MIGLLERPGAVDPVAGVLKAAADDPMQHRVVFHEKYSHR